MRRREQNPKGGPKPEKKPQIYVRNIPRQLKWWMLRKLIEEKVGWVAYVKIYKGLGGRSTGQGKVELWRGEDAQKTLERQWEIWGSLQDLQKVIRR